MCHALRAIHTTAACIRHILFLVGSHSTIKTHHILLYFIGWTCHILLYSSIGAHHILLYSFVGIYHILLYSVVCINYILLNYIVQIHLFLIFHCMDKPHICCIPFMSIPQFINIPLDGLLSCFPSLTNTDNVDTNIDI